MVTWLLQPLYFVPTGRCENSVRIHSTALIDPSAVLADDVEVGPYSIVGADVNIGKGSKVESHVVIKLSLIHI